MMDPQARAVLEELQAAAKPMPRDQAEWLKGYRAELEGVVAMQGEAPDVTVVTSQIPLAEGGSIPMRLYRPTNGGPRPTFLFLHGGGFVAGSLDGYDVPLRWLALRSGWQVAAPAYRLAPEHPFPAAPEDCVRALDHLFDDPACEVDADHVAVGGDSAGGLLAAVVAARARDGGRRLALQVLLYPNTDLREATDHASRRSHDGTVIRISELYRSLALYMRDEDRSLPHASPMLRDDLAGLCPALLVTNEYDPLRDEGDAYGMRLREANVPVTSLPMSGMIHTALQRGARIAAGDALISRIAQALREISLGG